MVFILRCDISSIVLKWCFGLNQKVFLCGDKKKYPSDIWLLLRSLHISEGKSLRTKLCRSWDTSPVNQKINFFLTSLEWSSVNHSLTPSDSSEGFGTGNARYEGGVAWLCAASTFWALFWHLLLLHTSGTAQSPSEEQYVCSTIHLLGHNTTSRYAVPRA